VSDGNWFRKRNGEMVFVGKPNGTTPDLLVCDECGMLGDHERLVYRTASGGWAHVDHETCIVALTLAIEQGAEAVSDALAGLQAVARQLGYDEEPEASEDYGDKLASDVREMQATIAQSMTERAFGLKVCGVFGGKPDDQDWHTVEGIARIMDGMVSHGLGCASEIATLKLRLARAEEVLRATVECAASTAVAYGGATGDDYRRGQMRGADDAARAARAYFAEEAR
jgi:hypothetical protein